jgi:hypothetical protein
MLEIVEDQKDVLQSVQQLLIQLRPPETFGRAFNIVWTSRTRYGKYGIDHRQVWSDIEITTPR